MRLPEAKGGGMGGWSGSLCQYFLYWQNLFSMTDSKY
jgi:hypothetical protein